MRPASGRPRFHEPLAGCKRKIEGPLRLQIPNSTRSHQLARVLAKPRARGVRGGVPAQTASTTIRVSAPGWIRTSDPRLRRPSLCPLSYGGERSPDFGSRQPITRLPCPHRQGSCEGSSQLKSHSDRWGSWGTGSSVAIGDLRSLQAAAARAPDAQVLREAGPHAHRQRLGGAGLDVGEDREPGPGPTGNVQPGIAVVPIQPASCISLTITKSTTRSIAPGEIKRIRGA
jgi:hypothetical protein